MNRKTRKGTKRMLRKGGESIPAIKLQDNRICEELSDGF